MARLVRIGSAVAATVAVLAFGVACNKSSGDSPGGNQAQDGRQAYVDCLRQHGVNLPDMGAGRPSGQPFPSGRPSGRPFPSGRPTSRPTDRPGGFPGGFSGGIPSGVDAQTWQQAQQACQSLRPSFGPSNRPGGGPGGGNGRGGANAAFRNCMSEHGVTAGQGELNTADPKVADALKICEVLRATATPSPSS